MQSDSCFDIGREISNYLNENSLLRKNCRKDNFPEDAIPCYCGNPEKSFVIGFIQIENPPL